MTCRVSIFFLGALLLLGAAGCITSKHPATQAAAPRPVAAGRQTRLTLVLKANWAEDSSVHFSIYNDIRNEGLLQQKNKTARSKGGFLARFTNEAGAPIDSVYIAHPLKERAETNTRQGKILNELFIKEEAYTEVSVQYTPEMKKLVFTELETQKQQSLDIR